MKIAVYTIAKNEEKNAEAFMKNCSSADLIVVGDTGSTDRTVEIISDMGGTVIPVRVVPWRFDIPRNTVLSVLPPEIDFCFAMDLDTRFQQDDWRDIIESKWKVEEHDRLRFRYIHSVAADGTANATSMKSFAHSRNNYIWMHAVHEMLYYTGPATERILSLPELVTEHRQLSKDRSSYLQLLELECNSPTCTTQHIFWLIREYVTHKQWAEVVTWTDKFMERPDRWNVERGMALKYKAKALSHLDRSEEALVTHMMSIAEAPKMREVWMDLAWYHYTRKQWTQAYSAVAQALTIINKPENYLTTEEAWGYKIHELAYNCARYSGLTLKAKEHIEMAMRLAPKASYLKKLAEQLEA